MEGPAVKRFVTAASISWPISKTFGRLSGAGHRGFLEDAGARLTMERLRRRIRLICAGCSEEQSRMTPLRRELPPSRGASRPDRKTRRRMNFVAHCHEILLPPLLDRCCSRELSVLPPLLRPDSPTLPVRSVRYVWRSGPNRRLTACVSMT